MKNKEQENTSLKGWMRAFEVLRSAVENGEDCKEAVKEMNRWTDLMVSKKDRIKYPTYMIIDGKVMEVYEFSPKLVDEELEEII